MTLPHALHTGWRRPLPVILQAEAAECGIACLAMVMGYYGHSIDLATLRRQHSISLKGTTLRNLIELAGGVGLSTRALRLELDDLGKLKLPCILHWGLNHFVVLRAVGRRSITIHDPARGRRVVPMAEVSREFTGVALEAQPTSAFSRRDDRSGLRLSHLFRNLVGFAGSMGNILLLSVCIEVVAILLPIGSQVIIDEVIVSADYDLMTVVGIGLALLLAIQLIIGVARTWAIMLMGNSVAYQWNTSLFDHLIRLPLDYFEKRHIGDVVSRFGSIATIQKALTTDLVQAVLDGVVAIGMAVMLFIYGGWLGWIALGATALTGLLRVAAFRAYRRSTEESIVYEATQNSHFMETVRGMAVVKLLGIGERRRAAWLNHLVDTLNARFRLQRFDLAFGRAQDLIAGADRLAMMLLGAAAVMQDTMTLGMLVAFLSYKDQFTGRVGSLIGAGFQLRMLSVQSDRLSDIVMTEPEPDGQRLVAPAVQTHPAHDRGASLRTEALSFRYSDSEPWIYRQVALEVPAGRCLAFTGPSGCGKTTFLKTLMGLLRPTEGSIHIDGADIRAIGPAAYRSRIAGVLQDDGLFAGSIADNIAAFDPSPDQAWIEECAARAAILDDIRRMPMGLETLVGDMGSTLSGGQRQRVVLARALYRRPAILFLDEATSHLDEATEALIATALRELRMTRILCAHRPATLKHADLVIPFASFANAGVLRTARAARIGHDGARAG